MKLFSLALLSYVATAQDVVAGEPDERGKYNPGNTECGGVAIKDKMNGDDELNFLCKSIKNKSSWSTMCRGIFRNLFFIKKCLNWVFIISDIMTILTYLYIFFILQYFESIRSSSGYERFNIWIC